MNVYKPIQAFQDSAPLKNVTLVLKLKFAEKDVDQIKSLVHEN